MGLFKNTKTRNIVIYSICGVIFTASIATICVVLWPKEENKIDSSESSSNSSQDTTNEQLDRLLNPGKYESTQSETVSCEELSRILGEDKCRDKTPQNYTTTTTYTPSTTTTTPATNTVQYNVEEYMPAPTPTPTCSDYHAEYYAEYQTKLHNTNVQYTNAINNAAASCKSFSGCPQKTRLENQWELEVAQLQNNYRSNMRNSGCDPSEYVSF